MKKRDGGAQPVSMFRIGAQAMFYLKAGAILGGTWAAVNVGRFDLIPIQLASILVIVPLIYLALIIHQQIYGVALFFRRAIVGAVLRDTFLSRMILSRISLHAFSTFAAIGLAGSALVFLAVEYAFVPVLLLNALMFQTLIVSARKVSEANLQSGAVSNGILVGAGFANYLILFLVYVGYALLTLRAEGVTPLGPDAIIQAESFVHGFHAFEIIGRVSIALKNITNSVIAFGGVTGIVLLMVVLLTSSLAPFVAFTLVLRWLALPLMPQVEPLAQAPAVENTPVEEGAQ